MNLANCSIEMRWYAHRALRSLLVFEIEAKNSLADAITVQVSLNRTDSQDLNITSDTSTPGAHLFCFPVP